MTDTVSAARENLEAAHRHFCAVWAAVGHSPFDLHRAERAIADAESALAEALAEALS